jgi:polysaccharide export outer membrane protein
LEFVYYLTRRQSIRPYQIFVGDALQISSASDASVNQERITVLPDGTISLPLVGQIRAASKTISDLQDELNDAYLKYLKNPSILVQVIDGNTPLKDIRDAVDSRFGSGGQTRQSIVSPDGTVQLPVVGSVPAVGLTLDEIRREVNARYRDLAEGIEVTPVLLTRAPRFVYVIGQVAQPGRYELVGPTTVMQAIALAQGDLQGGNLRNVVVFRRDEQWRLTATRLDLAGAIYGRRPFPSDEIYLRDSDIVLLPRKPIQRLSEAADLYLTRTLYAIFPEVVVFDLQDSVVSGGN